MKSRIGPQKTAAFRERARAGLPFIMTGMASRWPLSAMSVQALREHFGQLPVRARVGDYINTAFAPDRAMQDMTLVDYLEQALADESGLPPYLGNLELRELNRLCHWPNFFEKMGPPRFWIGPAGCITPLHCDYDDNVFAQVWGSKRVWLAPPHHDQYLYPRRPMPSCSGRPSIRIIRTWNASAGAPGGAGVLRGAAGGDALHPGGLVSPGQFIDLFAVEQSLGTRAAAGPGRIRKSPASVAGRRVHCATASAGKGFY
jgi:hypothetical protein